MLSVTHHYLSSSILTTSSLSLLLFFFNDTATTEIYTLSLHDALPISRRCPASTRGADDDRGHARRPGPALPRSEEHTSELQSHVNLVCRLLLEKKKKKKKKNKDDKKKTDQI